MGTSITYLIGENPMSSRHRKCDGKSLADYYLAVMADGMGVGEFLGELFGGHRQQGTQDKVIRHDFGKKNTPKKTGVARNQLAENLRLLTAYIVLLR